MLNIDEARGLLTKDVFLKVAVEERVGDVELVRRPIVRGSNGEHGMDSGGLDYQCEGL